MGSKAQRLESASTSVDVRLPLVLPAQLPCPAGKSPFHIKGSAYAGNHAHLETTVLGGMAAVLDRVEDPETRAYLSQTFLANQWYDYLPILIEVGALVSFLGKPPEEVLPPMASQHAERDLRGIYRFLLFFASPEMALRRLPVVEKQYFDWGQSSVRFDGKGVAYITVVGVPALAASFYELWISAFVRRVLVLSGGKEGRGVWEAPIPDGQRGGIPTVTLGVRITWTE